MFSVNDTLLKFVLLNQNISICENNINDLSFVFLSV